MNQNSSIRAPQIPIRIEIFSLHLIFTAVYSN